MVGRLILRGLLCGLVAGLLTFGFARVFGEPLVDRAVAFEEAAGKAKGEAPEAEIVSREVQAGLGLFTAAVVVGAAVGGLFAVAFALLYGRLALSDAQAFSAWLAFAAFLVLAVVPMVKYPANPPAVGDPATIGLRTALYFELVAVSLAAAGLAAALARALGSARGAFGARLAGVALFVALVGAACWLMPAVDEVPDGFSASLLWRFRLTALGLQAVLWATVGLGFGALARPVVEGARSVSRSVPKAAALR